MKSWLRPVCAAAGLLAALALSSPARAALETVTFDITGNDAGAPAAPVNPVLGSFTLTFNPSVSVTDDTANITVNSLNINDNFGPVGFTVGSGYIVIGNAYANGLGFYSDSGTDNFFFALTDSFTPSFLEGYYSQAGQSSIFDFTSGSVSAEPVPEPGSTPVLLGLGVLGWLGWRRARASAV